MGQPSSVSIFNDSFFVFGIVTTFPEEPAA